MVRDLGIIEPGTTLYLPFHTFDSNDPTASVTLTGLATTDIEIYKDGSTTQRASDAGYALLDTDGIDFDGITGIHGLSIDLADNTTAGFYAAGSQYWVVISSVTVDAATVNFVLATFRIGYRNAVLNTTIATLSSQTSFTLTAGPAEDDALNGMWAVIHDVASGVQKSFVRILDYTGSTKTVTLAAGATFTAAASDNFSVMDMAPLQPTTTGNTLDVTATGAAGVDWGNVENKTASNALTGTTIAATQQVDVNTIKTQTVTCAAGVTVLASVGTAATSTAQTGDGYAIVNHVTYGNSAINTKLGTPSDLGNGATIAFNLSDIHTDTAAIDAIASKLSGLVMASEVIGSTGNSTTAVHLSTLTYGNDEINDHLLVIYDNSTGEFHSRWITAWSNASKLATVATLPFTPENAVDTYYLTSLRRDMTATTVSDKTGYSVSGTTTTLDALQTALNSAHGAGSWATATGFSTHSATDVWAAGTRTLTAGTNIQLPSNGLANVTAWTVAITGNITGNLSGSVGSVSGAVGSVTGNVGGNVTGSVGSVLGGINTTAGVITTLDGLDTAQDTQHSTTQGLVTTVDTVVDAVKLKTDNLPASPAAVGSAMTLTSGERDSIAAALLDLASAIDGKTPRQTLRYMAAALVGRVSGAGTGTEVFKGLDESTTRITATVDSSGNRTDIAYD